MNCNELLEYLSAYLDHDLDADLTQAAQAHLATCRNCQVVLTTTQQVIFLGGLQHQRAMPAAQRSALFTRLQEAFLRRSQAE